MHSRNDVKDVDRRGKKRRKKKTEGEKEAYRQHQDSLQKL